jgi:hypothetical protein
MARRTPRVRVDRLELIAAAEQRQHRLETLHARELERYASALERYKAHVDKVLNDAYLALASGKLPLVDGDGALVVPCKTRPVEPPRRSPEALYLAATIAGLRHGVDELVWLSRDDAAYYFGPLPTEEGSTS